MFLTPVLQMLHSKVPFGREHWEADELCLRFQVNKRREEEKTYYSFENQQIQC